MVEKEQQHPRVAMSTKMTDEEYKELLSLDEGGPNGEEYSRRLEEFYKKHNFRSATLREKWAMDAENY